MTVVREIAFSCGCSGERPCYAAAQLFDRGDMAGLERHLNASAYVLKRQVRASGSGGASAQSLTCHRPSSPSGRIRQTQGSLVGP